MKEKQRGMIISLFIILISTPFVTLLFDTSGIVNAKTSLSSVTIQFVPFAKFDVPFPTTHLAPDIVWTGSRFVVSSVPPSALFTLSSGGNYSPFTRSDCFVSGGEESYMAITQPQNYKFGVGNLYVAKGGVIWKIDPEGKECTIFANIGGPFVGVTERSQLSHTSLAFDTEGSFDNSLLAATDDGSIWKIDYTGGVKLLTPGSNVGGRPECIDVAPTDFGPNGGKLIVGSESTGRISAITKSGEVSILLNFAGKPEHCNFLPHYINTTNPLNGMYIMASSIKRLSQDNIKPAANTSQVLKVSASSFIPYAGSLIFTDEYAGKSIKAITYNKTDGHYIFQGIGSSGGGDQDIAFEGFAFVNNMAQMSD
jgi:hypothetical protein